MWVRRYKDLISDDTACYGGAESLSVPRMSLLRRQAAALVECELIEAKMSAGLATPDDIDRHTRIAGNIRRCYEALGMDRVARPVNDGSDVLADYFRQPPAGGTGMKPLISARQAL